MLPFRKCFPGVLVGLLGAVGPTAAAADDIVNTSVSARADESYKRERNPDGSFKVEYYAISNGGRVYGTTSDVTVDRVQYPEVAAIAMRLLAGQNYQFARNFNEAKLLIVLQWGATISYNRGNYDNQIQSAASALTNMQAAGSSGGLPGGGGPNGSPEQAAADAAQGIAEGELLQLMMEDRMRESINLPNARLLGYLDDINAADGIQRYAGGGARYDELIADIEEPRYYIIVSAYDFQELHKNNKKKLLWVTRVSVRTRDNAFDDSAAAMLKSAAKHFGQNKGRLIRSEETKGTVRLGETKFLGEAKEPEAAAEKAPEEK
jgi:hypothetical protein